MLIDEFSAELHTKTKRTRIMNMVFQIKNYDHEKILFSSVFNL